MRWVNLKFNTLLTLLLWLPPANAEQVGDWALSCNQDRCELTQSVRSSQNSIKLKITIVRNPKGLFALVVTPLGIGLVDGLKMQVDRGRTTKFAFATCTISGCFSAISLTGSTLSSWKRGNSLNFIYKDGAGADVKGAVSLIGVTAGLLRL